MRLDEWDSRHAPVPNESLQVGLIAVLALGCSPPEGDVVVFAAASLRVAMEDAVERWPGHVRISTAGSQVLRQQIEAGAPADVFVAASFAHVRADRIARRLEAPALFACNRLILVVPPSSPIVRFEQLPEAERIVLGTSEVPAGAYADELLVTAGRHFGGRWRERVLARVVSREIDVRQVLVKVTLGEADAALVYGSDARLANVRQISPPDGLGVTARYPIALVRGAGPEARDLLRWLGTEHTQTVLRAQGFDQCPVGAQPAP
ncbi:molybdate ABC transporter substrate-binding protein [bacterium AH-315-N03]|nr:molybdate ABC transporter substrate-binding protein [bacterium AH-315-N03]